MVLKWINLLNNGIFYNYNVLFILIVVYLVYQPEMSTAADDQPLPRRGRFQKKAPAPLPRRA
jgi:hypothetical protein